jgi:hypothetical protein
MVKTFSKLFRKLTRVISDKTVPKSVRFMKWHVKFPISVLRKKWLLALFNGGNKSVNLCSGLLTMSLKSFLVNSCLLL